MSAWVGGEFSDDELEAAFDRLDSLPDWIREWDGGRSALGQLKNLTSQLIGRFAGAATRATREAHPSGSLIRFGASVVVPREIEAEIAVLKGIVAAYVMANDSRQPLYVEQREVLTELADALWSAGPGALDVGFAADFDRGRLGCRAGVASSSTRWRASPISRRWPSTGASPSSGIHVGPVRPGSQLRLLE